MSDYTPQIEIPYGYCHCGCGQKTKVATRNKTRTNYVKGQPLKYIIGHNVSPPQTVENRFWSKVNKDGSIPAHMPHLSKCWEWIAGRQTQGYGNFELNGSCRAHRIAWELTYGGIPDGLWVLHKCDNPSCVNPEHLFLGTRQDNIDDMYAKGREANLRGEKNGRCKLTDSQVIEIKELYVSTKTSQRKLAKKYGMSKTQIARILHNKR